MTNDTQQHTMPDTMPDTMHEPTDHTTGETAHDPANAPANDPAGGTAGTLAACGCGCGPARDGDGEGRKAVAVDADAKARNHKRLRRIEGQVRGLQKMVDEDRYCADIMTQIASVHEALRAVGRELMRNHLKHCASAALRGTPEQAEGMYDELLDLMYRHSR